LMANLLVNSAVNKNNKKLTTSESGRFEIENPEYDIYNYETLLDGYYSKKGSIKVEEMEKNGLVEITILLTPIETGITLALPNMLFVQSKPELLEISFAALDSVGNVMVENPTLEIRLSGHTDGIGDPKLNQQLSEDRVAAVKQYLVELGIDPKRIEIEAFGGRKPIASNAREETRRLNRRVEVTILKY
jgi:OmpA-OmpF porin, OOP family